MTPLAIAVYLLGRLYFLGWVVLGSLLQLVVQLVDLRQDCAEEDPEEQLLALRSYRRLSVAQDPSSKRRQHDSVRTLSHTNSKNNGKKIDARLQVCCS